MTPATAEGADRRARGDAVVWAGLGVVLVVVGLIADKTSLLFVGAFVIVPALWALMLARRAEIRHRAEAAAELARARTQTGRRSVTKPPSTRPPE